MRHPAEGQLRRLLDEPAGVAEADRRHVADCDPCLTSLTAMRADAEVVGAALAAAPAGGALDVDAAWRRLSAAPAAHPRPTGATARTGRGRRLLRRPATAALAVAVVLGGAGTAAANGWLQVFSTSQVAPVSISADSLVALPDLEAYGDLEVEQEPDVREVPDAATAARESGLDVPTVAELPRGVGGEPSYTVGSRVVATFTFSAEQAALATEQTGRPLPPVPPGLDGAQLRMEAGPGVAQVWSSDAGAPALVVARAVAPTAFSSGVPFEVVRDYLLSLPGLPRDVAEQLRRLSADGSTLPLPVPADQVRTSSAQVGGSEATVVESRDRAFAAVVWVSDGVVTAVGGSLGDDEALAVARALR